MPQLLDMPCLVLDRIIELHYEYLSDTLRCKDDRPLTSKLDLFVVCKTLQPYVVPFLYRSIDISDRLSCLNSLADQLTKKFSLAPYVKSLCCRARADATTDPETSYQSAVDKLIEHGRRDVVFSLIARSCPKLGKLCFNTSLEFVDYTYEAYHGSRIFRNPWPWQSLSHVEIDFEPETLYHRRLSMLTELFNHVTSSRPLKHLTLRGHHPEKSSSLTKDLYKDGLAVSSLEIYPTKVGVSTSVVAEELINACQSLKIFKHTYQGCHGIGLNVRYPGLTAALKKHGNTLKSLDLRCAHADRHPRLTFDNFYQAGDTWHRTCIPDFSSFTQLESLSIHTVLMFGALFSTLPLVLNDIHGDITDEEEERLYVRKAQALHNVLVQNLPSSLQYLKLTDDANHLIDHDIKSRTVANAVTEMLRHRTVYFPDLHEVRLYFNYFQIMRTDPDEVNAVVTSGVVVKEDVSGQFWLAHGNK